MATFAQSLLSAMHSGDQPEGDGKTAVKTDSYVWLADENGPRSQETSQPVRTGKHDMPVLGFYSSAKPVRFLLFTDTPVPRM